MSDTQIKDNKKKELRYKLTSLEVQQDVINRLARNESAVSIAKSYGVSNQRLCQIKQEQKPNIDKARQTLIDLMPSALEITRQDLKNGKKIAYRYSYNRKSITREDLDYKKQIQQIISDLFKMLGFFPHTNTSLHIGKFYQDNRIQTKVTPEYEAFLDFQEDNQAKIPDTEAEYKDISHKSSNIKDSKCG